LIYAIANNLPYAQVKNQAGAFVDPSLESVTAAAASAKLAKDTDFRVSITNAPGKDSYPISSFTWLLVKKDDKDAAKGKLVKDFLTWMITDEAQGMAKELHYAPLPAEVRTLVAERIKTLKGAGKVLAMN
jgi:phosphate transport system substrate-binding protein